MSVILRVASTHLAKAFPSSEALREYLRTHPNADPKKHFVRDDKGAPAPGSGGGQVKIQIKDKSLAKELGGLDVPDTSKVHSLKRLIEKGAPVPMGILESAMNIMKDREASPTVPAGEKRKMKKLREKLKKLKLQV